MKYIIEIDEIPFTSEGSEMQLFKATEFNSLVFDRNGLEKLTPYDESAAEQRGREEAWKIAKAIWDMKTEKRKAAFGFEYLGEIFMELSCAETIEKYGAWKKPKDEIKIGDEVAFHHDDGRPDTVVVVTYVGEDGFIDGMDGKGTQYAHKNPKKWTKTGRHFSEVADLLEKMRKSS